MFDLTSVMLIALLSTIAALFWQIRQLGELAQQHAERYCRQHQLQYLDIARQRNRLSFSRGESGQRGPYWRTEFCFGFSSDREHRYEGTLVMANRRLLQIKTPVYRTTDDFTQASIQPQTPLSKSYIEPDHYQRRDH